MSHNCSKYISCNSSKNVCDSNLLCPDEKKRDIMQILLCPDKNKVNTPNESQQKKKKKLYRYLHKFCASKQIFISM